MPENKPPKKPTRIVTDPGHIEVNQEHPPQKRAKDDP